MKKVIFRSEVFTSVNSGTVNKINTSRYRYENYCFLGREAVEYSGSVARFRSNLQPLCSGSDPKRQISKDSNLKNETKLCIYCIALQNRRPYKTNTTLPFNRLHVSTFRRLSSGDTYVRTHFNQTGVVHSSFIYTHI